MEILRSLSLLEAKELQGNNFLQAQDDNSPRTKIASTDYIKTKSVKIIKILKKITVNGSKYVNYFTSLTKSQPGFVYLGLICIARSMKMKIQLALEQGHGEAFRNQHFS